MKLIDLVCEKAVITKLGSNDRDSVIRELVDALDRAKVFSGSAEDIAKAVIKRENEASTGIGKGVAIPHVKSEQVKSPVVAIGLSEVGIDFSALDNQLVYSTILLISPNDNPDTHLLAMEVIFKNLQKDDFRSFLKQAKTVEAIMDLVKEADDDIV